MSNRLAAAIAILSWATAAASAGTYYVSPTGSDANNGSLNSPFKTLAKVSAVVHAGDTFYFRDGTYTGTLQPSQSGTALQPIAFRAMPGEHPVFDGQNTADYNIGPFYTNYTTFDGLELKNAKEGILLWGGNNRTITNCIIHDQQLNGVQFHNGANNDTIENCKIYDFNKSNTANYGIHCIQYQDNYTNNITIRNNEIYSTTWVTPTANNFIETTAMMIENAHANITGNIIHDLRDAGIVIWRPVPGLSYTVDDNTVYHVAGYGIAMDFNGKASGPLDVSGNILHDVALDVPSRFDINAMRFRGVINGATVADNQIYNLTPGHNGLRTDLGDDGSMSLNINLSNNSVVGGDSAYSLVQGSVVNLTNTGVTQHLSTLTLSDSSTTFAQGPAKLVVATTLLMQGAATLNVKDNDLLITTASLSAVRSAIVSGRIFTDLTTFPPSGRPTALGYAAGNDPAIAGFNGLFNSEPFGPGAVLIKYTFVGDANLDGSVDGSDVALWAQNFTGALGADPANPRTWTAGDFNGDGSVDGSDVALWAANFTGALGGGGLSASAVPAIASLPEPTSAILLTLAATALGLRRRDPRHQPHAT